MKKIFFIAVIITLFYSACDVVENPYPKKNQNICDSSYCDTAIFPPVTTHIRRVLIEDYTGHTCGNCPKAAAELKYCDSVYSGQIIPLAIHVGYFAEPCPPHALPAGAPAGSFSNDYTCLTGNEYDNVFMSSAAGLPQGIINRKNFNITTGSHLVNYASHGWTNFVGTFISTPPVADLQIVTDFNFSSNAVCTSVKSTFLSNLTGNYNLVVLLTQDSIISWQVDYRYVPNVIPAYTHKHMLRDAINSTWGDTIVHGSAVNGQNIIKKYCYKIPAKFKDIETDPHHMHIVAFIYDADTYEVIQAAEAKVIE